MQLFGRKYWRYSIANWIGKQKTYRKSTFTLIRIRRNVTSGFSFWHDSKHDVFLSTATTKGHDPKQLREERIYFSLLVSCQGSLLQETATGTEAKKAVEECCFLNLSCFFLFIMLSITAQGNLTGVGTAYRGMSPLSIITNQKNYLTYFPIGQSYGELSQLRVPLPRWLFLQVAKVLTNSSQLISFFKKKNYFIYMSIMAPDMYVYYMHAWCSWKSHEILELELQRENYHMGGYLVRNSESLQKHQILLISAVFLQPHTRLLGLWIQM